MPDLSAYLSVNAILDNSGSSPVIKIVDVSAYPGGVAPTITGTVSITEPDGITMSAPNITWVSGALTQSVSALRLANNNRFQSNGLGYTIKYVVSAPGYTTTTLIKTFTFNYVPPVQILAPGFDNFTPKLTITDATSYGMTGFNLVSVSQSWAAIIANVNSSQQNISGVGNTFDLAYLGNYYDSSYDATLTAIVTYQLILASVSVTLIDKFSVEEVFVSEIPPTLIQLLTLLTSLKALLDAAVNNSSGTVGTLQQTYTYAVAIYEHMINRGQNSSLAGLSDYVYQLQKIFNNGVTPTPANTGTIIPPYNWGGSGATTVTWNNIQGKPTSTIMQWTVGQAGFPLAGASTANNAGFAGQNVVVFRNNMFEPVTKPSLASSLVNFSSAFVNNETIFIFSLPL